MSHKKTTIWLLILAVLLVGGYGAVSYLRRGFSAREKPSWWEEYLARSARKIATPAGARKLRNPYPESPESIAAAREHWVSHCATCHGLDGRGDTAIGRNLYPPAPDMTDRLTQDLSDGELFYIITNGVRFTGMPAWGEQHGDKDTWELVSFIRRLPTLTPEELKLMREMASQAVGGAGGHSHAPGTPPHKH